MSALRRLSHVHPGYDCMAKPCGVNGCGTRPGASHGQHCDDWFYTVTDGEVALSLSVFAGNYPRGMTRPAQGAFLSLHLTFPVTRDQLVDAPRDCDYVDGGKCYSGDGSGLAADELWKEHHVGEQFEQPDSFWVALEEKWGRWAAGAREERKVPCATCAGRGHQ